MMKKAIWKIAGVIILSVFVPATVKGAELISEDTQSIDIINAENGENWYDDFEYTFSGTSIYLSKYKGSAQRLVIPGEAEIDGKKYKTKLAADSSGFFEKNSNLVSVDMSKVDTSETVNMSKMFDSCDKLRNIDISGFDTKNVIDMSHMFTLCRMTELDLSNFNTSNVTDMSGMFCGCNSLKKLNLSSFNTSKVTDMSSMFYQCNLSGLDVSGFDTSNVTKMDFMFARCPYYYDGNQAMKLDLRNFNTSKVTSMIGMFEYCDYITDIDVSSFETSNVTNMSYMFYFCSELTSLDFSGFDTSKIKYSVGEIYENALDNLVGGCNKLKSIKAPSKTGIYAIKLPGEGWINTATGERVEEIGKDVGGGTLITREEIIYTIKGDITGDNQVAMGDVVKLAKAVAGNITLTDVENDIGDVNGDGQIAMGDVVKLARYVAGTIKEL